MVGNKSILKGIDRCNKRISRAKNKKQYSRKPEDIESAESMIKKQESKKLRLQQHMIMNNILIGS